MITCVTLATMQTLPQLKAMIYTVIPGFIGNMGNIHIRINKQPACVLNPYFGQATENALVRTLPEVSAQRRRVLVDKLRYFPPRSPSP